MMLHFVRFEHEAHCFCDLTLTLGLSHHLLPGLQKCASHLSGLAKTQIVTKFNFSESETLVMC